MAELSTEDRQRIARGLNRWWSALWETTTGFGTADILDAVVATDQWQEANQAAYNAALPEPFKSNATQAQKTLLHCAVALARAGINFLRLVFGEVD